MEAVLFVFFLIFMDTAEQYGMFKEESFSSKLMFLQSVGFVLFVGLSVLDKLVWNTSCSLNGLCWFLNCSRAGSNEITYLMLCGVFSVLL